jgi:hypothetical protein
MSQELSRTSKTDLAKRATFIILLILFVFFILAVVYSPIAFLGYHLGKSRAEQELLRRKLYGRATN